jgi:ribosomal protein L37AE/L43A
MRYLRCKHGCVEFVENVYGDNINHYSSIKRTCRSLWYCKQCGKILRNEYLINDKESKENALRSKFY